MIRRCPHLLATGILLFAIQCANVTTAGNGGSSETVNAKVAVRGTTVRVTAEDATVDGFSLRVYSQNYHPYEEYGYVDSSESSDTNILKWTSPAQATLNFLLTARPSGNVCFLQAVSLKPGINDTIECVLGPPRSLAGCVAHKDSTSLAEEYVLSILGSPFYGLTDSTGRFVFEEMPPGNYTMIVLPAAKRLFASSAEYSIVTDSIDSHAELRVVLP